MDEQNQAPIELPDIPELTEETKKKIDALKSKVEEFQKIAVKEEKSIMGISLLAPKVEEKDKIKVLVVVDLDKEKNPLLVKSRIIKKLTDKAKNIDKNLLPEVLEIYDVREACYDGKYEILKEIAISAPIYDPSDFLKAVKISEVHKNMVLKKFDKYIVCYVAAGSLFRGEKSNDIDVYIVIDDTDVKRMTRFELKDRLLGIIREYGFQASEITGIKKAFHIQTYILTDFWESVKDAQPVIYTFLRDGIPLFDRGIFMPWKLLLRMGRIRPSPEAIDVQMDLGERLIKRTKGKLLSIIGEDLYYAILNPAQAALMLYGISPPTPKETIKLMDEIFVKKEKILEKEYIAILDKIRTAYKNIEHGKVKDVKGKDIDTLLKNAEEYLARIKKLFAQIEKRKNLESVDEMYSQINKISEDLLLLSKIKPSKNRLAQFKKLFIDTSIFTKEKYEIFKQIFELKKIFRKKPITTSELEKVKRSYRTSLNEIIEYIEKRKSLQLDKIKIRFKYGQTTGELLLINEEVFIISDVNAKDKEVQKAVISKAGILTNIQKSSYQELENEISKLKVVAPINVKGRLFENLKSLFGSDIEILMG